MPGRKRGRSVEAHFRYLGRYRKWVAPAIFIKLLATMTENKGFYYRQYASRFEQASILRRSLLRREAAGFFRGFSLASTARNCYNIIVI